MRGVIKFRYLIALSILLQISFATYGVECGFSISSAPPITFQWSSSDESLTQTVTISRVNKSQECKNFQLAANRGGISSYNRRMELMGNVIPYNLYTQSSHNNPLLDYPDVANKNDVIKGSFKNNKYSKNVTVYALRPQLIAQNPPGGVYSDLVTYKLYSDQTGYTIPAATKSVLVTTIQPKFVHLSLVDSGSPFDISDTIQNLNFGTLNSGDIQSFDIRIKSNSGHAIYFSSQNDGNLKHATLNELVNYTISVDGGSKELNGSSSSPVLVATAAGQTPPSGSPHQVTVQIEQFGLKAEGDYSDNITITVMTTE